ncbi:MAG TPA: hypothetical protein VLF69_03325 [Candidatus Saccharimonadales bacterium]|nr:hypothetical protein [Candidatus Saccharimonadales bacterium]
MKRDDLAGAHATAVDPAQRRQEVADLVHAVRMTRNAFQLIARVVGGRAVLSDDDIVRLLGGDE